MQRILNYARFYNFYQNIIGCKKYLQRYSEQFIKPKQGDRILDIACGTGNLYRVLPKDINYTGVDYSSKYINYCSKKFPNVSFIVSSAFKKMDLKEKFDVIVCEALLACGSDEQIDVLFENIKRFSAENTRIILSDMNYSENSSLIEKFLYSKERGSYVRSREDYIKIISKHFNINNCTVIDNPYIIPYSKIVFECSLK